MKYGNSHNTYASELQCRITTVEEIRYRTAGDTTMLPVYFVPITDLNRSNDLDHLILLSDGSFVTSAIITVLLSGVKVEA